MKQERSGFLCLFKLLKCVNDGSDILFGDRKMSGGSQKDIADSGLKRPNSYFLIGFDYKY
ncbi:MAG: hypothetical protein JWN56_2978 [Sphingobacteriales bacterium]|nr:hypothetical protein [Sphingobacteriales bacterium]